MPRRNLFREGYIDNTVTVSGVVSGTQFVTIQERDALVDGDYTSTALTVSGGELVSVTADFGARFKLDEIEYYTDEPTVSGFSISISDDDVTYQDLTMTGAPPRYAGPVPVTAISGAPQYVRLEHFPTADAEAYEWTAINDETLVDFGDDGTQEQVNISDAPIGKPSDTVTELKLYNQFSKPATGFVFVDETGDAGDDNIELALNPSGPWFGRNTLNSVQPDVTPWTRGSYATSEIRLVPSGAYSVNFADDTKGWAAAGFTASTTAENSLKGVNSTSLSPYFYINNSFGGSTDFESPIMATGTLSTNPTAFAFPAQDFDTVNVRLTVPNIPREDTLEHPRLFWRHQGDISFSYEHSVECTNSGVTFSNQPQEFTFDVGNTPTWSGTIRSFRVQPWVTATGLGYSGHINNLDVIHSSGKERLALAFQTPSSGTQALGGGSEEATQTVIAFHNIVTKPCIITGIEYNMHPPCGHDNAAFFLARLKEGNSFPSAGTNFEVKYVHTVYNTLAFIDQNLAVHEPVFWGAEPGDFLGFGWSSNAGCDIFETERITFSTGFTGAGWTTGAFIPAGTTPGDFETFLDGRTWTDDGRRYNMRYTFVVSEEIAATGDYTTPIFDSAAAPGLTSARFESTEPAGTSVDTLGGLASATNTFDARASRSTPKTSVPLGNTGDFKDILDSTVRSYRLNAGYASTTTSYEHLGAVGTPNNVTSWSLNQENTFLSALAPGGPDGDTYVENFGAALFYHENKNELWVLNVMLSGTISDGMYPVWDRYDMDSGYLISTDAMQGPVNYTYFHGQGNSTTDIDARIFEPVCFLPDYDREEIYIVGRLPQEGNAVGPFTVGANTYLGVKMDLDGNFKSVIWDTSSVAFDTNLPDDGFGNPERAIWSMRDITYDGTYFYVLTAQIDPTDEDGKNIYIYRWGVDDGPLGGSQPDQIEFIQNIEIAAIPGLGGVGGSSRPMRWLEYNTRDGLFYMGAESSDEMFVVSIEPDDNEVFNAVAVGEQGISYRAQPSPFPLGFNRTAYGASDVNKLNNWDGAGSTQRYRNITDVAYIESRNSFATLMMLRSSRSWDWFDLGINVEDYFAFRFHNYSFVTEVGGGGVFESELPSLPASDDAVWGSASGTLEYDLVQENGALFPTGQFSQLRYQLNADPGMRTTPYLEKSQISQGLRVENIPAAGTKTIYLRTNIPEGTTIEEQTGRLKVFWELEE